MDLEAATQPAVAVGRTGRSLRSLSRPPLNGRIVGRTRLMTNVEELIRRTKTDEDEMERFVEVET
jgi:hypothetical protein